MTQTQPKQSWFLPILTLASFLVAGICFAPRLGQLWQKTEPAAVAASNGKQFLLTKPIEQIRPGDRVLAHNPEVTEEERKTPDPDPATWRLMELELIAEDGHRIDVRLLRPGEWIKKHGGFVGGKVNLKLEEIGAAGQAGVLSVSDCPPIQKGSGRVVTGTFRHHSAHIIDVHIKGQPAIGCTPGHLFWSEDRQTFVPGQDLKAGENLQTADGRLMSVIGVTSRASSEEVFNLEVDTENVYYVGQGGVLVHNTGSCVPEDQEPITDPSRLLPSPPRPTPQQSELDVARLLPGWHPQHSFLMGNPTKWGQKGSSRPDISNLLRNIHLDVKNYDLSSANNRYRLYTEIEVQARLRAQNLPQNATQGIILDIRGQSIDPAILQRIPINIQNRTGGLVQAQNVFFLRGDGFWQP